MPSAPRGTAEHRQALVLGAARVGAADEQDVVGDVGLGDPRLLAVDDVAAVAALGAALQRADVGAGLGLGHRDRLDARRAAMPPSISCFCSSVPKRS